MQSLPMHHRQMESSVLQLFLLASIFYTEARDLYLLEGNHVTLDIHGHEDFRREEIDFVRWSFHGQVVKYYPAKEKIDLLPQYLVEDGVKFDSRNFSVILMNLQISHSGLYRGQIGASGNILSTEYNISVLEPVSTPNLTVVSNWSSADSCNVTLTCRGHDLSLTFICNGSTCTHKGGAIIDTSLVVVSRDDHIVCNHSNRASWRYTVLGIRQVCPIYFAQRTNSSGIGVSSRMWISSAVSFLLATAAGFALFTLRIRKIMEDRRNKGRPHTDLPGAPDPAAERNGHGNVGECRTPELITFPAPTLSGQWSCRIVLSSATFDQSRRRNVGLQVTYPISVTLFMGIKEKCSIYLQPEISAGQVQQRQMAFSQLPRPLMPKGPVKMQLLATPPAPGPYLTPQILTPAGQPLSLLVLAVPAVQGTCPQTGVPPTTVEAGAIPKRPYRRTVQASTSPVYCPLLESMPKDKWLEEMRTKVQK